MPYHISKTSGKDTMMADLIGQQLGNYRLMHLLGRGGFAEVYLGEHIHLGAQAAIKVLHTHLGSQDVEQFRRRGGWKNGLECFDGSRSLHHQCARSTSRSARL